MLTNHMLTIELFYTMPVTVHGSIMEIKDKRDTQENQPQRHLKHVFSNITSVFNFKLTREMAGVEQASQEKNAP